MKREREEWDVWVMGDYEWHQMNLNPFETEAEAQAWALASLASNHHFRVEKRTEPQTQSSRVQEG